MRRDIGMRLQGPSALNRSTAVRPMSVRVFCALLMTLGCSGGPPAVVYVPGDEFKETVWISTGAGASPVVHVNAPLTLHARRNAGPWVEIPGIELKAGQCWWGSTPPEFEPEVADNVRWLVDPDSTAAVFNVQFRSDHTREVRFSRPGVYQLTAYSNVSCAAPATVDTLTVRVINHQQ